MTTSGQELLRNIVSLDLLLTWGVPVYVCSVKEGTRWDRARVQEDTWDTGHIRRWGPAGDRWDRRPARVA